MAGIADLEIKSTAYGEELDEMTLSIDEAAFAQSGMKQPEERLFLAIIAQAALDAVEPKGSDCGDARKFLLYEHGAWAESRSLICECAGVNGAVLRRETLKTLGIQQLYVSRKRVTRVASKEL